MTKIILLFWVLSDVGVSEPQEIDGWRTMEECEAAAVSLTEANPKSQNTYRYALIAQCLTVPK